MSPASQYPCTVAPCNFYLFAGIRRGTTATLNESLLLSSSGLGKLKVASISLVKAVYRPRYCFRMVEPKESADLVFEDAQLRARFRIRSNQIDMILTNKTASPIRLDWNSVSYVDIVNKAHKVFHKGVPLAERAQRLESVTIPPRADLEEFLGSVDHVAYSEATGWSVNPLFPSGIDLARPPEFDLTLLKGAKFTVFLPIAIDGRTHNYSFVFEICDVNM